MIKASELRIGNWVRRLNNTNFLKVVMIDIDGSVKFDGLDEHLFDLYENQGIEPIPLTPEILEKCRFENSTFFEGIPTGVYRKNGLKVGLNGDDFIKDQYTAKFADDICVKVETPP